MTCSIRHLFRSARTALLASLCLLAANSTFAHDTFTRIEERGEIVIGHRMYEMPFSYVANDQVLGYSVELCQRVVESIRQELRLHTLRISYVPVTPATRFVLLASGRIDLECGTTTNNADRRRQAEFSYPHFLSTTRFVSLRSNHFERIADLAGRSVVSTTGSINVGQLRDANRERKLNVSIMLQREHKDAFSLVATGQAAAFVMDDVLLAGLVASTAQPHSFAISNEAFGRAQPYGLLMQRGDLAFKTAVNRHLRAIFESGDIHEIYARWFENPVPPAGQNLRLPMSPELRAVFAAPREYLD